MTHLHSSKYVRKIRTSIFTLLLAVSTVNELNAQFPAENMHFDLVGHVLAEMTLKMDVTPLDTVVIEYYDSLKFHIPPVVSHVIEKYYNGKLVEAALWRANVRESRYVYFHNAEGLLTCIANYSNEKAYVDYDMRKSTEDSTEHYWINNKVKYKATRDELGRLSEFNVAKAEESLWQAGVFYLFGYPHYLGMGYDEFYRIKYTYSGFLKRKIVLEQFQDSTNHPFDDRRVDVRNRRGELISEKLSYTMDAQMKKQYEILKCRNGYILQTRNARFKFKWVRKKSIEMSIDDGKSVETRTYKVHVI